MANAVGLLIIGLVWLVVWLVAWGVSVRRGKRRTDEFRDALNPGDWVAIFGKPDFCHRVWDPRALADIAPGDTVVWANYGKGLGDSLPPFLHYTFDDSREDIIANGGERGVDYL